MNEGVHTLLLLHTQISKLGGLFSHTLNLLAMSLRPMAGDLSASIRSVRVGGGVWVSQCSNRWVKQRLDLFW